MIQVLPSLVFVLLLLLLLLPASTVQCFVLTPTATFLVRATSSQPWRLNDAAALFAEEEEMIPVAEHFVRAKYQACAKAHGHDVCTADDAREILRSILPPVSPKELEEEVDKTLAALVVKKDNDVVINEDDFVKAIVQNSYWREAGDLVVKEMIYFESLHAYYQTGISILDDDDYNELKDNLIWEGSSVPNMKAKEALFVTAVAAARRGEPILDDDAYVKLKASLKQENSWVVNREADVLEKLGVNTFMGYLHRAQKYS
jgi:hypothetical protein